jgi:regulatory protein
MPRKHAAEWLFDSDEPRVAKISRAKGHNNATLLLSNSTTVRTSAIALSVADISDGTTLDAPTRARLVKAETVADAVRKALRLLSASSKSALELHDRLTAKGIDDATARRAVEYLQSKGMIDEAEIAQRIIRADAASPALARHQMEQRRLAPAVIDSALRRHKGPSALDAARTLNAKLSPSLSPAERRTRLLSALSRRGYDEHDANDAVNQIAPPPSGEDPDT